MVFLLIKNDHVRHESWFIRQRKGGLLMRQLPANATIVHVAMQKGVDVHMPIGGLYQQLLEKEKRLKAKVALAAKMLGLVL